MQLLAPRRVGPKKKGDGTLTVVDCRVESSIEFIIHSIPRWHGACLDDDAPRVELCHSCPLPEGVQIFSILVVSPAKMVSNCRLAPCQCGVCVLFSVAATGPFRLLFFLFDPLQVRIVATGHICYTCHKSKMLGRPLAKTEPTIPSPNSHTSPDPSKA